MLIGARELKAKAVFEINPPLPLTKSVSSRRESKAFPMMSKRLLDAWVSAWSGARMRACMYVCV